MEGGSKSDMFELNSCLFVFCCNERIGLCVCVLVCVCVSRVCDPLFPKPKEMMGSGGYTLVGNKPIAQCLLCWLGNLEKRNWEPTRFPYKPHAGLIGQQV